MTKPLYIFDLDGTLADLKHRRHFVEKPEGCICDGKGRYACYACTSVGKPHWKPNWDAFYAACVKDTPIRPVVKLFDELMRIGEVWIWSGRSEIVRRQTVDWLSTTLDIHSGWGEQLRMRPAMDYTVDHVLKERWLHSLSAEDRERLVAVFDDRNQVVEMWRRNGVLCCQVAPGDF